MKKTLLTFGILIFISLGFFYKTLIYGLLPVPADALVGLYHPYRDYFADKFPRGVPYKNYILTDPALQQIPWKWLAINGWKNGKIPRENPYNFSGVPLLANVQAGAFYPLNILFFVINNFSAAWTIFIMIQPVLSAIFMYLYLKSLSLSRPAALFGGLVWAFSSFNMVWLEWGNVGHAGLWLPLALLAVDKIIERKKDIVIPCLTRNPCRFPLKAGMTALFWHGLLQFSLVSSLLAGHTQITLYLFFAVALYWFMRLGVSKKSILPFTVHCLLFTVLTSFQWVPGLKAVLASNRAVEQADVLTREGFFIEPRQLFQAIAPDYFGNPATGNYRGKWNYAEQIIYVGILPLILGLTTRFHKRTKSLFSLVIPAKAGIYKNTVADSRYPARQVSGMIFFAWLLVAGGLIFAVKNPIAEMPYRLNILIWSDFQPTRLSYLITFGLAVLAAIGLEGFIVLPYKFAKNMFKISTGIGAIFLALLVISGRFDIADKIVSQRNLIFPAAAYFLFMFSFLFLYFTRAVLVKGRLLRLLVAAYWLLVAGADLFRFGWKFTPFSPREYWYPATPAIKFLQNNMKDGDRYMTLDRRILPPNANIMYGLKSIEGYDPIYSQKYARLITEMETGSPADKPVGFGRIVRPGNWRSPVAKKLGVKYVLSLDRIDDGGLREVFNEGEVVIYEKTIFNETNE